MSDTNKTADEILESCKTTNNEPITNYVSKDGTVWKMILKSMQEFADLQTSHQSKEIEELKKELLESKELLKRAQLYVDAIGNYLLRVLNPE